jgi:hypothetical protein
MPLTRPQVETLMARRLGRLLQYWNLDGVTADGTNPDVGASLARSLMGVGVAPADATDPTDEEVARCATERHPELLDLTHLHLLEACLDNTDEVRQREGVNEQEWNGRISELRRRYEQKRQDVAERYGEGLALGIGGTIAVQWLEPDPEATDA